MCRMPFGGSLGHSSPMWTSLLLCNVCRFAPAIDGTEMPDVSEQGREFHEDCTYLKVTVLIYQTQTCRHNNRQSIVEYFSIQKSNISE
jgi:hypothetical protein